VVAADSFRLTLMEGSMNSHLDSNEIANRVGQYFWFHSIDLGNGIVTPGLKSPEIHAKEATAIFDETFELARSVLGLDVESLGRPRSLPGEGWRHV
jgi:hypothetical protein